MLRHANSCLVEGFYVPSQIYTWDGCAVDVITEDYPIAMATDMVYTSDETPMVSYLNTHQARLEPHKNHRSGIYRRRSKQQPQSMLVCSDVMCHTHVHL